MAHSLELVSTRGFYGTATDRIVAISTRGFYDVLAEVTIVRLMIEGLGPKYGFAGKDAKHKFKDEGSKYKFGTHQIG